MIEQLLCHLWGDYILQSDWMAQNKTKAFLPAWIHASLYTFGFLLLRPSQLAIAVIMLSHFLIDRYRLARYVVIVKNVALCPWREWENYLTPTGYPPEVPAWLSVWLLVIADNTLHMTINYLALRFL